MNEGGGATPWAATVRVPKLSKRQRLFSTRTCRAKAIQVIVEFFRSKEFQKSIS